MTLKTPLILLALFTLTSFSTFMLKPTLMITSSEQIPQLSAIIPESFAGWHYYPQPNSSIVDPQVEEAVNALYNETLTRTYINRDGQQVMLSIAYGIDQSDAVQMHKPEVCYPAQGFQLKDQARSSLVFNGVDIPVKLLTTQRKNRREFVTYWMLIGDQLAHSNTDAKIIKLNYGFSGVIPDGLLFRVSTIGIDAPENYSIQEQYVYDLLSSVFPEDLQVLIGR